jgi:hypothetical protein
MNERIKELLVNAMIEVGPDDTDLKTLEKFTELIVRECANVAADHDAIDIYEEIREHFGVEE